MGILLFDDRFRSDNNNNDSRSTAEFDGGVKSSRSGGVGLEFLDGDADRDDPDGVGVRLVKHSTESLDGLGCRQTALLRKHLHV